MNIKIVTESDNLLYISELPHNTVFEFAGSKFIKLNFFGPWNISLYGNNIDTHSMAINLSQGMLVQWFPKGMRPNKIIGTAKFEE
jgi:hypothetical protein